VDSAGFVTRRRGRAFEPACPKLAPSTPRSLVAFRAPEPVHRDVDRIVICPSQVQLVQLQQSDQQEPNLRTAPGMLGWASGKCFAPD
jgi:hypothetical protein